MSEVINSSIWNSCFKHQVRIKRTRPQRSANYGRTPEKAGHLRLQQLKALQSVCCACIKNNGWPRCARLTLIALLRSTKRAQFLFHSNASTSSVAEYKTDVARLQLR